MSKSGVTDDDANHGGSRKEARARNDENSKARATLTIFSADVRITGAIVAVGEVVMNGHLEGDLRAALVTIGATGRVQGDVSAETIILRGVIEGHICGGTIEICDAARHCGDITYGAISISGGANVEAGMVKPRSLLSPGAPEPGLSISA